MASIKRMDIKIVDVLIVFLYMGIHMVNMIISTGGPQFQIGKALWDLCHPIRVNLGPWHGSILK